MKNRIQEARNCLKDGLYEAALALALTLPDICGQVEYPSITKVGERYTKWFDKFVDSNALYDKFFDEFGAFQQLKSQDIYKLRCSLLHSGDQDISSNTIDYFELVEPGKLGIGSNGKAYGYQYGNETQSDGSIKHTAYIDIKYLTEILCDAAEKYYNARNPSDFEDHTLKLM